MSMETPLVASLILSLIIGGVLAVPLSELEALEALYTGREYSAVATTGTETTGGTTASGGTPSASGTLATIWPFDFVFNYSYPESICDYNPYVFCSQNDENIVKLNLSGSLGGYLPNVFQYFEKLVELDLENNAFNISQDIIFPPALVFLRLTSNLMESIPWSIFGLNNLEILDLSNNRIKSVIPNLFANLTNLHLLDLSNNAFYGTVPSALANLQNLRFLDLSNNILTGTLPIQLCAIGSLTIGLNNNYFPPNCSKTDNCNRCSSQILCYCLPGNYTSDNYTFYYNNDTITINNETIYTKNVNFSYTTIILDNSISSKDIFIYSGLISINGTLPKLNGNCITIVNSVIQISSKILSDELTLFNSKNGCINITNTTIIPYFDDTYGGDLNPCAKIPFFGRDGTIYFRDPCASASKEVDNRLYIGLGIGIPGLCIVIALLLLAVPKTRSVIVPFRDREYSQGRKKPDRHY